MSGYKAVNIFYPFVLFYLCKAKNFYLFVQLIEIISCAFPKYKSLKVHPENPSFNFPEPKSQTEIKAPRKSSNANFPPARKRKR